MPFGKWDSFESCLADIKKKNPGYSDEVAKKVCGKLQAKLEKGEKINDDDLSPSKEDLREVQPVVKAWEFDPKEIMNSPRKVQGTFHVPKIDKDNEIITKGAMDKAIPNFIHLPILHDFHRERTLGLITKVWEESDAYHFEALFKATHDVDDAWDKVKRGVYDHVSIYGSRLEGNASCALDPVNRATPCVSSEIRLDSISACDENARNDSTSLTMRKGKEGIHFYNDITDTFIKAETSNSGLVHGTFDGVERGVRRKDMEKCSKCGTELKAEPEERTSKIAPAAKDIVDLGMMHDKRHKEENVEKGSWSENQSGRGDLQRKQFYDGKRTKDPAPDTSSETMQSSGRRSQPYVKSEEVEKSDESEKGLLQKVYDILMKLVESDKKVHATMEKGELDWSKRKESETESGRKEGVSSKEREDFSRVNRSLEKGEDEDEEVEKGDKGSVRFVDADKDDKKTYAEHRKEESPKEEKKAKEILTPKHETEDEDEITDDKPKKRFNKGEKEAWEKKQEAMSEFLKPKDKEKEEKKAYHGSSEPVRTESLHGGDTVPETSAKHPRNSYGGGGGERRQNNRRFGGDMQSGWNKAEVLVKKGDTMTDEVKTEEIQKAEVKEIAKAEMTDEQFVQEIVKANLPKTDEIVKAQMEEISKAFKVQIDELKAEVEKLKNEPIQKAAVFIQEGPTSGMAEQYQAIAQFGKVK